MIIVILIFCALLFSAFLTMVYGMAARDIRFARIVKRYRMHPYAKVWRERPLVSILFSGEPTTECLQSIRRSSYRKIQIVENGHPIKGELILTLPKDALLESNALRRAVRELNFDSALTTVELTPVFQQPLSLRELFRVYRRIASTPFMKARAGLNVALPYSSWPMLMRRDPIELTVRTRVYLACRWPVQVANIATLTYAADLALAHYQPELLIAYLFGFALFLVWTIGSYGLFTFSQKLAYLILSPVSIVSFFYHALLAPLRFMQYAVLLPTRRKGMDAGIIEL